MGKNVKYNRLLSGEVEVKESYFAGKRKAAKREKEVNHKVYK
jgi:hypothetical protein